MLPFMTDYTTFFLMKKTGPRNVSWNMDTAVSSSEHFARLVALDAGLGRVA